MAEAQHDPSRRRPTLKSLQERLDYHEALLVGLPADRTAAQTGEESPPAGALGRLRGLEEDQRLIRGELHGLRDLVTQGLGQVHEAIVRSKRDIVKELRGAFALGGRARGKNGNGADA